MLRPRRGSVADPGMHSIFDFDLERLQSPTSPRSTAHGNVACWFVPSRFGKLSPSLAIVIGPRNPSALFHHPIPRRLSYNHRMKKTPVSVTLSPDNLLWLEARTIAERRRSLSETLDRLIRDFRASSGQAGNLRSAVGTVSLPADDPDLKRAKADVRRLFQEPANDNRRREKPKSPKRKRA